MIFEEFFRAATGERPYPYQKRFATADALPHLLHAPTGAGKTATTILGWLWRLREKAPATPRRLVYCLPMRVLVEQSYAAATQWIQTLGLQNEVDLHLLMGGVDTDDWFLHPEKPAVLIGTQDMLLSRALNRGYAENRFHWPIDFGLLNNDALWIFDEPQLMGNGVSTSAQLAGLRKTLGTFGPCWSVWMSATLEAGWLNTIDFVGKFLGEPMELDHADYDPALPLHKRMTAAKTLAALGVDSSKDMKVPAKLILEKHAEGTQTLAIVNTVDRAKSLYSELIKLTKKASTPMVMLIHSRFRPKERAKLNEQLQRKDAGDRIIVATQVVEAGVDISSRTLVTELSPWASIVQRIGRCNRTGDDGPGQVFWLDLDDKMLLPYDEVDLAFSRNQLKKLDGNNVSPKALNDFKKSENIELPFEHKYVLRRRDLIDLFDTAPDLSGNDIDIQRFVRSDDPDTDVQVFWREILKDGPNGNEPEPAPVREELCSVPFSAIKDFLSKKAKGKGFVWDHLDEEWKHIRDPQRELRPGLEIMLPANVGGYSPDVGWDPDSTATVTPFPPAKKEQEEGFGSNLNTSIPVALTISEHTQHVCDELSAVLETVWLEDEWIGSLKKAALWHDVGKAHEAFQYGMKKANPFLDPSRLWAKSGVVKPLRHRRRYFRHELASALAALQQELSFEVAYLILSHHGRARLAIRTLPDEDPPASPEILFALGVQGGDALPAVDLGGESSAAITLDLSPMQLGGDASWTGRALKLLVQLGPFKLAYLEALLRAADCRASQKEVENA